MISKEKTEAMLSFIEKYALYRPTIQQLSDGRIFISLLQTLPQFSISPEQISNRKQEQNISLLIQKAKQYAKKHYNKQLYTKDIDAGLLFYNRSEEEIGKLFEIILLILIQSKNKQNYIETILKLSNQSQQYFVTLIQDILDKRFINSKFHDKQSQYDTIKQYQTLKDQYKILRQSHQKLTQENIINKQIIDTLREVNLSLKEEIRLKDYGQRDNYKQSNREYEQKLEQELQSLKQCIIQIQKDHQSECTQMKNQIQHLVQQLSGLQSKQMRNKEKEERAIQENEWEREKRSWIRRYQQKNRVIQKLQLQINRVKEEKLSEQKKGIYLQIQLQKRQIRFKQLQTQIRNHIGTPLQSKNQKDEEEIKVLKDHLQEYKAQVLELQRDNAKNERKLDKINILETQKRKLQNAILQVTKTKDQQLQLLITALYSLL